MSSLGLLMDQVLGQIGRTNAWARYSEETLGRWLNEGQNFVSLLFPPDHFPKLTQQYTFTTVNGTEQYDLPSDNFLPISLKVGTAWAMSLPLERRPAHDTNTYRTGTATRPYFYVGFSKIGIMPAPTSALSATYEYMRPAQKITALGEPELPEVYEHLIVRYAVAQSYLFDERNESHQAAMSELFGFQKKPEAATG